MEKKSTIPIEIKFTLKSLRSRASLTQKEAATLLGISDKTLHTWEQDSSNLSLKQIEKIEAIYHISRDYIFFGTNNAFSEKALTDCS